MLGVHLHLTLDGYFHIRRQLDSMVEAGLHWANVPFSLDEQRLLSGRSGLDVVLYRPIAPGAPDVG